jgi:hypothetical protein
MEKLFRQIGDEVREYTAEEYEQHAKDVQELEILAAKEIQEKEKAALERQALLNKLGITADEAKLLLQ